MKKFKHCIAYLAVFAVLFTSCSKEEAGIQDIESEKATLSFGAILNDLATRAATKQAAEDIPACSDDTPSYVEIVLMNGDNEVVGTADTPHRVNLATGQVFTVEDPALELTPGNYTLDHFAVYNNDGDLIWVAPRTGSALGEYVNNALPLAIDLRAGVKKYVDVSVLCFDNREVNEYGYLFYELDTNVALEFCLFANYCTADGRHYPARYSVNIWSGTNNQGTPLYTNVVNNTSQYDNGDFYASPLCFALPDNDEIDEAYLYYEVTLLDWDENYGEAADGMVLSGTLTKRMITDNFGAGDEVEYEHLRFGCDEDDGGDGENGGGTPAPVDSDNDGVPNATDACPTVPGPESNNGCPEETGETDSDNDGTPDATDNCPTVPGPASNNGCPVDTDNDGIPDAEDNCPNEAGPASNNGCPVETEPDTDNDGIPDAADNCPNEAGPASNNGCPVPESCIPATPSDCERFTQNYSVNESFVIHQVTPGDLSMFITEEGLFVGITPVAPYEISAMEVTIGSTVICAEDITANEGGSVIFEGITEDDLPLNVGVKINYCNISE